MGRRTLELDERDRIQLEALARFLTQEQIADYFGISQRTFNNMRERDEDIDAIYKKGRSAGLVKMASSLFQNGIKGNVTAQIFYLKTQGGWREVEHTVTDLPQMIINGSNTTSTKDNPES